MYQIKYGNIRQYIIKEYGRILKCDEKLIKKFYQEIFYWNTDNTKAPKLTLDIATIEPRIFLLETSKYII